MLSFYRADYDNFMFKSMLEEPRKTFNYITLWVRNPLRRGVLDPTLCDEICQWLATGRWFFPVYSTNKTQHHDITEILLKVALNTITLTLIRWRTHHLSFQNITIVQTVLLFSPTCSFIRMRKISYRGFSRKTKRN